jgi:O-antigen ligase
VRLVELGQDLSRLEQGDVDSSAGARYERLQVAWEAFIDAPWTGVGMGRFDSAMTRLPVCRDPATAVERCHLDHAHNDLAEWGATRGIPGVLALLAIYGVPLWVFFSLWRGQGRAAHGPAAAGMAVVLIYMVCGLTQSMFAHQITAGVYASLVGILAGLALNARRQPG